MPIAGSYKADNFSDSRTRKTSGGNAQKGAKYCIVGMLASGADG
jgi:hypothetical protein